MMAAGRPFKVSIPDSDVADLARLMSTAKWPGPSYENTQTKEPWGVSLQWMRDAVARWSGGYSWRESEAYINRFPQFIRTVTDRHGEGFDIHYVGLMSEDAGAIPVLLLHGWPGSFLELLELAEILSQPSANRRNMHLILPSLPGYAFSSSPPLDRDFDVDDAAFLLDGLMSGLGFGKDNGGYVAHGGDLGGILASLLAAQYDNCNAAHINFLFLQNNPDGSTTDPRELDAFDQAALERTRRFFRTGTGYAQIQATRPSTMGFVIASSPLALLAWVGEKFPTTPTGPSAIPLDKVLDNVTLWWFTDTFPRSIYHYRHLFPQKQPLPHIHKPFGLSCFPGEVVLPPRRWAEAQGNLVYYKRHSSGGHFAAMEKPEELAEDLCEFLDLASSSAATTSSTSKL